MNHHIRRKLGDALDQLTPRGIDRHRPRLNRASPWPHYDRNLTRLINEVWKQSAPDEASRAGDENPRAHANSKGES
jgi:hypothetical protein